MYDIAFAKGKDVFATVGADGSVRMFDLRYVPPVEACPPCQLLTLARVCRRVGVVGWMAIIALQPRAHFGFCSLHPRSLEHSTIMYESEGLKPLLRLSWNKQDANYLATVGLDSSTTTILDIRCVLSSAY